LFKCELSTYASLAIIWSVWVERNSRESVIKLFFGHFIEQSCRGFYWSFSGRCSAWLKCSSSILLWIFPVCLWMNESTCLCNSIRLNLDLFMRVFQLRCMLYFVHSGPWIFILFSRILCWVLINKGHRRRICRYAAQSITIIFCW
jgi:hypothetical protein